VNGLLADVNIQGELAVLRTVLHAAGLLELLTDVGVRLYTFADFGLDRALADRPLWHFCQQQQLILFTDNRNRDDPDSLEATLSDSLRPDSLPVLTPGDKSRFRASPAYQLRVARSVADVLFGLREEGLYYGTGRLFVPLPKDL
jgi:hypothetical protein